MPVENVILHQPPAAWGLPNPSPFCAKLETYLRMVQIPYELGPGDPRRAPKKKIPYIRHEGRTIGDSQLIIDYLKQRFGDPLDEKLDPDRRALAHVTRRAIEEGLYFAAAYLRWTSEEAWPHLHAVFRPLLPPVVGGVILNTIRRQIVGQMHAQGTGRHSREEILAIVRADIDSFAGLLGDKPYLLGDDPASLDASMYGFLINIVWVPWSSPEKGYVASHGNLVRYCERMKARYWA
jgi:glutathione S-transferase